MPGIYRMNIAVGPVRVPCALQHKRPMENQLVAKLEELNSPSANGHALGMTEASKGSTSVQASSLCNLLLQ